MGVRSFFGSPSRYSDRYVFLQDLALSNERLLVAAQRQTDFSEKGINNGAIKNQVQAALDLLYAAAVSEGEKERLFITDMARQLEIEVPPLGTSGSGEFYNNLVKLYDDVMVGSERVEALLSAFQKFDDKSNWAGTPSQYANELLSQRLRLDVNRGRMQKHTIARAEEAIGYTEGRDLTYIEQLIHQLFFAMYKETLTDVIEEVRTSTDKRARRIYEGIIDTLSGPSGLKTALGSVASEKNPARKRVVKQLKEQYAIQKKLSAPARLVNQGLPITDKKLESMINVKGLVRESLNLINRHLLDAFSGIEATGKYGGKADTLSSMVVVDGEVVIEDSAPVIKDILSALAIKEQTSAQQRLDISKKIKGIYQKYGSDIAASRRQFIVHDNIKDYKDATIEKGSGFSAGYSDGMKLAEFETLLKGTLDGLTTGVNADFLIFSIVNLARGAVGSKNKTMVQNYVSTFIALWLFDDFTEIYADALTDPSFSGVKGIHLLNLNGRYWPLSYLLFNIHANLVKTADEILMSNRDTSFVKVSISEAAPNIEPYLYHRPDKEALTEQDWIELREETIAQTSLRLNFMRAFKQLEEKLFAIT